VALSGDLERENAAVNVLIGLGFSMAFGVLMAWKADTMPPIQIRVSSGAILFSLGFALWGMRVLRRPMVRRRLRALRS
jgi:hypothetical protein